MEWLSGTEYRWPSGQGPSPYFSGKYPTEAINRVFGTRSSARACGSPFCPTTAQSRARPASSKARNAPSALGSFAAPTRMRFAVVVRKCLRTRSPRRLNWPSPSMIVIALSGKVRASRNPVQIPRIRARGNDPARVSSRSRSSSTLPSQCFLAQRARYEPANRPASYYWRRNTYRRGAERRRR